MLVIQERLHTSRKRKVLKFDRITLLRKHNHMTEKELCGFLHVSTRTIQRWEHGESNPNLKKLSLLADLFMVSMDCLLGMTGIEDVENAPFIPMDSLREINHQTPYQRKACIEALRNFSGINVINEVFTQNGLNFVPRLLAGKRGNEL